MRSDPSADRPETDIQRRRRVRRETRRLFTPKQPHELELGVPPLTAQVRCNGSIHRVVYDGQYLHLPDHPDIRREEVLFELGGACRCLEVRRCWARGERGWIPDNLREAFDAIRMATRRQRHTRRHQVAPYQEHIYYLPLSVEQLLTQHHGETVLHATSALTQCAYKKAAGHHRNVVNCVAAPPTICGRVRTEEHLQSYPHSILTAQVHPNWVNKVEARNLDVIDGQFVLDVVTPTDLEHYYYRHPVAPDFQPWWLVYGTEPDLSESTYVLAGHQGRGYSVYAYPAQVVIELDAQQQPQRKLRWYEAPKKRKGVTS